MYRELEGRGVWSPPSREGEGVGVREDGWIPQSCPGRGKESALAVTYTEHRALPSWELRHQADSVPIDAGDTTPCFTGPGKWRRH